MSKDSSWRFHNMGRLPDGLSVTFDWKPPNGGPVDIMQATVTVPGAANRDKDEVEKEARAKLNEWLKSAPQA